LTPERKEFCEKERLDPERTIQDFRDYWKAAAGSKAVKVDWNATWRMWCRREAGFTKPAKPQARNDDAAWSEAKAAAKEIGFREPWPQESVGAYMTNIKLERNKPPSRVLDFKNVLKRVPI